MFVFNLYKMTWWAQHLGSLILLCAEKKKRGLRVLFIQIQNLKYWRTIDTEIIKLKCKEETCYSHIYKMRNLHLYVPETKSTENLKGLKCSFKGHCTLSKTTVNLFYRNLDYKLECITKYMYGGNLALVWAVK